MSVQLRPRATPPRAAWLTLVPKPPTDLVFETLSDDTRPAGFALTSSSDGTHGRAYLCHPGDDCINVLDEHARPLRSFGGRGDRRGQFREPADVTVLTVHPQGVLTANTAILVVADRGNHRLQFFHLDGEPLVSVEDRLRDCGLAGGPARSGWPFFRLAPLPRLDAPCRLAWRPPVLEVTVAGGLVVPVDVRSALLPGFDEWLQSASTATLRRALTHFLQEPYRDEVPASCLQRIAEHLRPSTTDFEKLAGRSA